VLGVRSFAKFFKRVSLYKYSQKKELSMRPVALTSFKKRCIVPATVQMFLQNSVLEVEGPLGKAELHLKTYDKKKGLFRETRTTPTSASRAPF
jgi:hypothetical protein